MTVRYVLGTVALVSSLALTAGSADAQRQARGRDDAPRARAGKMEHRGNMAALPALLRGIELTDAQKVRMRDIHLKHRARHEAMGDTIQANRAVGIRPDSTMRLRREQMVAQERAEMRAILTAEQQKTFDANVTKMQERMQDRREKMKDRAPRGRRPTR